MRKNDDAFNFLFDINAMCCGLDPNKAEDG